jgi:hypothetical protein
VSPRARGERQAVERDRRRRVTAEGGPADKRKKEGCQTLIIRHLLYIIRIVDNRG